MTEKRRNDRKKKTRENPCKSMRKIINEKKSVYICEICGT